MRRRVCSFAAPISLAIVCPPALAVTDLSFDYTSFETGFQQAHFNVLNYPSINGNYMMTSTDNHRPEMVANNNTLAEFYNNWLADYNKTPKPTAEQEADAINTYTINNSANNGPRPTWLVLNELSSSLWSANPGPSNISTYRTWVMNCVRRLRDVHGYNVVALAPFQNPGANDASWQELSAMAYVGAEVYLSGTEVWNSGADNTARYNWARSQYQSSKTSYLNRGVPENKLFIIEHFANNNATYVDNQGVTRTTGWGRAGLASAADWDTVIQIRQDAIRSVDWEGFMAYNWGGNAMGITQAEQLQHEYYYRSKLALASQQPQWLSDTAINVNGTTIPLSWGEFLNWKGGVPNAAGAVANFFRTNTAARTVTLDGSRSVGILSFNSPSAYTISPGSGGSLTLNNSGSNATVTVTQGSHVISAQLALASNATISLTGSLTLSGGISNATGKTITKTGSGSLSITGAQTHGVGAAITNNAGSLVINSDAGSAASANLTLTANSLVTLNSTQHLAALNIGAPSVTLSVNGSRVINTGSISVSTGKLDLVNNDLIVRNGNTGSWNGSTYTGVLGLVQSGRNNGAWTGSGIITSRTEAKNPNVLTTLAVARAGDVLPITGSQTALFSGETVTAGMTLVKYTYGGDANLDGTLNGDDYFQIDSNINQSGSVFGYVNGDFDYDGAITGDDYFIIDSNINLAQTPLGGGVDELTSIPEPAVTLLALSPLLAPRRRRARARASG